MARSQSAPADTDSPPPLAGGDPAPPPALAAPLAPLRFAAPDHVSAITLSTERVMRVEDGVLTAPNDLSDHERRQILRAGFAVV
jgi:hypothetical protein